VGAKAREIEAEAAAARRQLDELQRAGGERAAALREDLARRLEGLERDVEELRGDVAESEADAEAEAETEAETGSGP
jgi:hypothetical protein